MANKILTPLHSLISHLLERSRRAAVDVIEGFWQGLLPSMSWRLHCLLCPSSCCQAGEGSSVCCAKNQAKENCVGTCQAFSCFLSRLWRRFFSMFFPLLSLLVFQFLPPFMLLSAKYWEGQHLSVFRRCALFVSPVRAHNVTSLIFWWNNQKMAGPWEENII